MRSTGGAEFPYCVAQGDPETTQRSGRGLHPSRGQSVSSETAEERTLSGEMQVPAHRLWLLPLSVVVAGAGYETAVAVGALNVGPLPGAEPPGRTAVFLAAELALLVASVAAAARIPIGRRGGAAVVMLPPAAAAFLLARFVSFDAYYAPTLRRCRTTDWLPPALFACLPAAAPSRRYCFTHGRGPASC